jgi:hypothetical protein
MLRGRVCRPGSYLDDNDNYYLLLVAIVHRAVLDLNLKPDTYKCQRYALEARENLESAKQFVELARLPKKGGECDTR